jgi:hypothetical protein
MEYKDIVISESDDSCRDKIDLYGGKIHFDHFVDLSGAFTDLSYNVSTKLSGARTVTLDKYFIFARSNDNNYNIIKDISNNLFIPTIGIDSRRCFGTDKFITSASVQSTVSDSLLKITIEFNSQITKGKHPFGYLEVSIVYSSITITESDSVYRDTFDLSEGFIYFDNLGTINLSTISAENKITKPSGALQITINRFPSSRYIAGFEGDSNYNNIMSIINNNLLSTLRVNTIEYLGKKSITSASIKSQYFQNQLA